MKNNTYNRFASILMLISFRTYAVEAQTSYTDLPSPIGLEFDAQGRLLITENGTNTTC